MVRPLIVVHFAEKRWKRRSINEPEVPVLILIDAGAKIASGSHFMYDFILGVTYVYNELRFIILLIRSELCFFLQRRGRASSISFRWRLLDYFGHLDGLGRLLDILQLSGEQGRFMCA